MYFPVSPKSIGLDSQPAWQFLFIFTILSPSPFLPSRIYFHIFIFHICHIFMFDLIILTFASMYHQPEPDIYTFIPNHHLHIYTFTSIHSHLYSFFYLPFFHLFNFSCTALSNPLIFSPSSNDWSGITMEEICKEEFYIHTYINSIKTSKKAWLIEVA